MGWISRTILKSHTLRDSIQGLSKAMSPTKLSWNIAIIIVHSIRLICNFVILVEFRHWFQGIQRPVLETTPVCFVNPQRIRGEEFDDWENELRSGNIHAGGEAAWRGTFRCEEADTFLCVERHVEHNVWKEIRSNCGISSRRWQHGLRTFSGRTRPYSSTTVPT